MIRRNQYAILAVALSTLAILVATLHTAGGELPTGWSLTISDGDDALAGLIQNLLLFIPLGASLVLAGVHPLVAVAIGSALSCSVEVAQQWIPGRDPSLGDIICNANSTAIGVALVVFAPRWLWPPPRSRRAAWQALATACLAVLVWLGTGAVLRSIFPDPPITTSGRPTGISGAITEERCSPRQERSAPAIARLPSAPPSSHQVARPAATHPSWRSWAAATPKS